MSFSVSGRLLQCQQNVASRLFRIVFAKKFSNQEMCSSCIARFEFQKCVQALKLRFDIVVGIRLKAGHELMLAAVGR